LRFFSHSKNDTVTPPAFMYRSGMTRILRSIRILSAAGVVGPLAASAIIWNHKNVINCGHTQFKLLDPRKPFDHRVVLV
jgi:hypothetical protein